MSTVDRDERTRRNLPRSLAGDLCSLHGFYAHDGCPGCPTRADDPERYAYLDRLAQHTRGSGTVALFLAATILLSLLTLAVVAGRAGMCTWHDDRLSYCDGYEQVQR